MFSINYCLLGKARPEGSLCLECYDGARHYGQSGLLTPVIKKNHRVNKCGCCTGEITDYFNYGPRRFVATSNNVTRHTTASSIACMAALLFVITVLTSICNCKSIVCKNSGIAADNGRFCYCLPGTDGDYCEKTVKDWTTKKTHLNHQTLEHGLWLAMLLTLRMNVPV